MLSARRLKTKQKKAKKQKKKKKKNKIRAKPRLWAIKATKARSRVEAAVGRRRGRTQG
jgi:hypothetical protein